MNMRQPLQPLLQHLFQVSNLEDVSWQRLESFVADYPAFGIGHYLLSRKLRTEGSDRFAGETQRTSLYFTNPYWLEWLLHNEESNGAAAEMAVPPIPVEEAGLNEPAELVVMREPVEEAELHVVEVAKEDEAPVALGVVTLAEEAFAVAPAVEEPEPVLSPEESVLLPEETVASSAEETVAPPAEPEPSAADLLLRSIKQARELRESLHRINRQFGEEEKEDLPAGTIVAREEAPAEPVEPAEPEIVAETAIVFEPYHTIDYFASQGIRLSLDENPGDQLGRQLKSFTDWLKMMRRLPKKEAVIIPDRVVEQEIRDIAEHSIERKDVVTETMAEVFVKQGMKDAARAVYEKLSLLNPDKRGYFVAKIEQLNIP
jgi:hypothetical protein